MTHRKIAALGLAGLLVLAACGDDEDDAATATTAAAAETTTAVTDEPAAAGDISAQSRQVGRVSGFLVQVEYNGTVDGQVTARETAQAGYAGQAEPGETGEDAA